MPDEPEAPEENEVPEAGENTAETDPKGSEKDGGKDAKKGGKAAKSSAAPPEEPPKDGTGEVADGGDGGSGEVFELVNIEDEMKKAYIDYSMSVIIGRALPDARDGLKPCNRRILYGMSQGGWNHNKPFVKCARVVGEVMGKYHPHGDNSVYDALVRMAQDFAMRAPLIDGQGNFGSIDGDRAAAYRYTECRLKRLAEEMLADIDKETVDMRLNFDEKLWEPTVLPTRVPNLLLNGSTGIAVGMATNIPPHNLNELVDGTIHLIDNPECEIADLMQFIKGPDFPTGCQITGFNGIKTMYTEGKGIIRMRGHAEIEEHDKKADRIIITSVPYAVNKANMIAKIADLVNNKVIEGIRDLWDESNKKGIRVVIELKRNAMPRVVLNQIYKHSALATSFGANMLALDNNRPRVMNLKELLNCFVAHRYEVVVRRAQYDLQKAKDRAHILEGYLIALDNLDELVKLIRASANREEAREKMMPRFGLSKRQANAILDMRLYQLTGLERGKIEKEYAEIKERIDYLEALLASDEMIYDVIKEELGEIKAKYGTPRITELTLDESEIDIEDLIENKPTVITISHTGYIKRVPAETYREQRRGGKGVKGMDTKDEDFVEQLFMASTHDTLLFLTSDGRMFRKKVYQVPEGGRTAKGRAMSNLLELQEGEKIDTCLRITEFSEDQYIFFCTRNGVVKKTNLAAFKNVRVTGIRAIGIDDDDQLIGVYLTTGDDTIILITRNGMSIHFHESKVRSMGRTARGVRGIKLKSETDAVVAAVVVQPEASLFIACENGYGKRTAFSDYPLKVNRGGLGVIAIKNLERNGPVVGAVPVTDEFSVMLITEGGITVKTRVDEFREIGRNTAGVRIMRLKDGDKLIAVARLISDEEEPELEEGAEGEAKAEGAEENAPPEDAEPDTEPDASGEEE